MCWRSGWTDRQFWCVNVGLELSFLLYQGVPPDRQTLMVKGKKLQDGASWDSTGVKNKAMILMMGSAEEVSRMDI